MMRERGTLTWPRLLVKIAKDRRRGPQLGKGRTILIRTRRLDEQLDALALAHGLPRQHIVYCLISYAAALPHEEQAKMLKPSPR